MRGRRLPAPLPLLLVLAGLVALGGCSSGSFVGRRLDNFTAYYNTFYNAKKAYREGVKALEARDAPIDRDAYLDVFAVPERSGSGEHFSDAIQKSADVLRKHDASKWADDALLLIGTAYFYGRNYVGAEQKFREVIGLDGRFERSPLKDEARFWLARTLIASGAYEAAAAHLEETLRGEDLPRRWEGRLRLALGELHVKRGAWAEAAAALEEGLRLVRDDELGARAQFLRGQALETLGDYEAAAEAFERVRRYDPLFELAYAAEVSALRVRGLHGDAEGALERLRRMERDDKYYDRRAELAYLRARIYHAEGRTREAEGLYRDLLYDADADLNIQAVQGRVHYGLGELYRDAFGDYFLAAAHFDTAGTALGAGARRGGFGGPDEPVAFTAEALPDGAEQARVFGNFARVMADVGRMDSLLYLGGLDEAAFEEAILEVRRQRAEEMAEQQRLLAERQARQRFSGEDVGEGFENGAFARDPDDEGDEPGTSPAAGGTAGFLFHRSPVKVQEGRLLFFDRWGERPLVPNWRRGEAVAGETTGDGALSYNDQKLRQLQQLGINPQPQLEAGDSGLPDVDVSDVPRDPESQRAMRADRASARYELANVLFLQMNRPDSAAAWYRTVIEEDAEHAVAQRAYYALAEVQQALGDTASSERIYRAMLADYPDSEFAGRIRQRLGLASEAAAQPDSAKLAEEAYRQAFRQWERGAHRRALREMLDVAAQYRRTPVAPKALTAAGSIYAEWARRDGLDPLTPLPLRLPEGLLAQAGLLEAAGPPDSTRTAARVPGTPADSLAAPLGDGLAADPDSARVADGLLTGNPPSDSLVTDVRAAEGQARAPLDLETLYASVARNYPQSPYAERARQVLEAIDNLRAPVEVNLAIGPVAPLLDSSATGAGQAAAAPPPEAVDDAELALREQALLEEQQAIREARAAQAELPKPEPDEEPLRGGEEQAPVAETLSPEEAASIQTSTGPEGGIDLGEGDWTFVAASGTDRASVEAALREHEARLGQQGMPGTLLVSEREGTPYYRAAFGRFPSENDARMAFQYFGRELPGTTRLLRLRAEEEPAPSTRLDEMDRPLTGPEPPAEAAPRSPEADVEGAAPAEAISGALGEEPRPDERARPAAAPETDAEAGASETVKADVAGTEGALPPELPEAEKDALESPAQDGAAETGDLDEALRRELAELEALRGQRAASAEGGIDPAEGGWAIVVASGTDSSRVRAASEPYAARLRLRGLPTDVVASETNGAVRYRALAGQYASRSDAQAALTWLAEELPHDAWLLRIRPDK